MLRSTGQVLLNKNSAPASAAIYPDDLVETQKASAARIEVTGSAADINPETMVQFEGAELALDHGSLSVNTSRGLRVRVGCITVIPVKQSEWTRYEVADVDGKVTVSALQSDVNIETRSSHGQKGKQDADAKRATVQEGEQKSRDEKCVAAEIKESAKLPGEGAIMNSPLVKGVGLATIGGLTCWAVCRSTSNPVSPVVP